MSETSKSAKKLFNWSFLLIVLGLVVVVNIIGNYLYKRIDMTEDGRYSLNRGTIAYLEDKKNIQDRLLIKIYLDGKLPAEIKRLRNAIEDKLNEFKYYAGKKIEYKFFDPVPANAAEQDKRDLKEILYNKGKGILPMNLVYSKDGSQTQMQLWPGAEIEYNGSTQGYIQFLPGTTPKNFMVLDDRLREQIQSSINNLEYTLLSSIRKAIKPTKPRIAFLHGHGELSYPQTLRVRTLLAENYTVEDITLNDSIGALEDVKGVIIAAPRTPYSEKDKYLLDQFLLKGGSLMCFLDKLTFASDTLNRKGMVHTTRLDLGGLDRMLFDYGMKINDNYVVDAMCGPKLIPAAKESLIPWFFYVAASPTKHPITRNVDPVMLRYASEIQFIDNQQRVATPILTSSSNSNVTGMAPMLNLMMYLNYAKNPVLASDPENEANKRCVAGLVEGTFESHFKNRIVDAFAKNPQSKYKEKSIAEGKVLVVSNGDFIKNYSDSMPSPNHPGKMQYRPIAFNNLRYDETMAQAGLRPIVYGNQDFFQNLVDYMLGDNSVLDIRSKNIEIHPIDQEKVKTDAGFYKLINMVLPSAIILILAVIIFYLRKRKYTHI